MTHAHAVDAVVRDVVDGKLTTCAAVDRVGATETDRLREGFTLLCTRYQRLAETVRQLEDENKRLLRRTPTAVWARRCFVLAVLCVVLSAATQAVVWVRVL